LPFQITPLEERREVKMRKAIRIVVGGAVLAAAMAFFVPSTAQGQVSFSGRFPLPHGSLSVGVGDPYSGGYGYYGYGGFPVGSYVPYGYRVIYRPRLGYGFYSPGFACRTHRIYHSHWIPVRRYHARYVVVERPVVERRVYDDRYSDDRYYRGDRPCQPDGAYCGDPYYDFNRTYWDRSYDPHYR
jgi:hypothetical protein